MTTITVERAFLIEVLHQLDVAQSLLERSQHHAKIAAMYEELRAALAASATASAHTEADVQELLDLMPNKFDEPIIRSILGVPAP